MWKMVQRGETEAGEEENGLQVERRFLGYRKQVGTDLYPKYDRGLLWGPPFLEKASAPQTFCWTVEPVES